MTRRGGHLLFWLVLIGGASVDLVSKHVVFGFLRRQVAHGVYDVERGFDVWPGVFSLFMRYNTGGPFSIFSGHNSVLVAVSLVALAVIIYLYVGSVRQGRMTGILALAVLGGGALGNIVDRLCFHKVRDFLNFYIIGYPVFNVADVLITIGIALLIAELLRSETSGRKLDVSGSD